jgi:hypothetical protein
VVNFEVVGEADGGFVDTYFWRVVNRSAPAAADVSAYLSGESGKGVQRLDLHLRRQASPSVKAPTCDYGSTTTLVKHLPPAWDIVGQTYSRTIDVTHTFTYKDEADSSLGVAISASASTGFSVDVGATSSVATASTTGFPTYGNYTGVYYKTQFTEAKYKHQCTAPPRGGNPHPDPWYTANAIAHYGGAETRILHSYPDATQCSKYLPNKAGFTKDSSTAWTWTDGFTLPYLNLSVSTSTGYTTAASVHYVVSHITRYLCGISGGPAQSPGQIVAGRP